MDLPPACILLGPVMIALLTNEVKTRGMDKRNGELKIHCFNPSATIHPVESDLCTPGRACCFNMENATECRFECTHS